MSRGYAMEIVRKGRKWVVEGADDEWVGQRTFARKWLAELALTVFQQGGGVKEYWRQAVEMLEGNKMPWSQSEEIERLFAEIEELRPTRYEMLAFAEDHRSIVTKVPGAHEYKVFPPRTDRTDDPKVQTPAHINMRCRDYRVRLDCDHAREFIKFIPYERGQEKQRNEAFPLICEYIKKKGGITLDGLTAKKLMERGKVIDDPEYPDHIVVFTLERHQGMMGSVYTPGQPMGSFKTYWPKYAFDLRARTLQRIGDAKPPEATIDHEAATREACSSAISLTVEPLGGGHWHYRDSWSNEEGVVTSVEELEEVAAKIVDGIDFIDDFDIFSQDYGDDEAYEHVKNLREAWKKAAKEEARAAWENAQKAESD